MTVAESITGPSELSDEDREAVETLLFRLADDEFVIGDRYTDWQVRSPTLESDLALSNIAQDEIGHARLWYDLLEDFGYDETDLIWQRQVTDFTHSTLCELPFADGDWADVIVRSYLYDAAEAHRLDALVDSTYPRIRDRVETVQGEEEYHTQHARRWLERLAESQDGHDRVQAAIDRLLPYGLTLFQPTDGTLEARIDDLGLRTASLGELRDAWWETVSTCLERLEFDVTEPAPPDRIGRDGMHTDHWAEQHADITATFRELGRNQVRQLMGDPDEP